MSFFKSLKKVFKVASNTILPNLGVVGGAVNGVVQGGGLKGALQGGLQGGVNALANIGGQYIGSQLVGNSLLNSLNPFGTTAGSSLDSVSGVAGAQGPTQGSGFMGAITRALGENSPSLSLSSSGGGASSFGSTLSNIASGVQSYGAQDKMKKQLLEAQGKSEAALSPYYQAGTSALGQLQGNLSKGFDPSNLESDAGYQFNLNQGLSARDKAAAARGGYYSGAALKEAEDYGTNLANTYTNDYYNRWSGQNNQLASVAGAGQNAANSLTNVYDNQGNINANATVAKNNILSNTLASVLRGSGRAILGYRSDGTPIYDDNSNSGTYKLVSA